MPRILRLGEGGKHFILYGSRRSRGPSAPIKVQRSDKDARRLRWLLPTPLILLSGSNPSPSLWEVPNDEDGHVFTEREKKSGTELLCTPAVCGVCLVEMPFYMWLLCCDVPSTSRADIRVGQRSVAESRFIPAVLALSPG
ncbi:hypothetical protein SKAU_G00270290 [Synaphobranchus kaupii]|uniref:Uncharacterized protein n=1 Tax=Synaphobranchus kaupii TaxID=118154 RepID=A0A9Q1F0C2_SYNKA|nr:hypothetical protein SKAU_G00270290 [Synaphobranchus kaupii]